MPLMVAPPPMSSELQAQPGPAQCAPAAAATEEEEAKWEELLPETLWAGGASSKPEPVQEVSRAEEQEEAEVEGKVETDGPL